jgi:pimeloyl-ACP methyl ester carboxylesterase
MPTINANGVKLYYEESGAGPAMLFIHGMAGFAGVWSDQMARLGDTFRCVAYDRRGHTRSERGNITQETVELHADDAAALIHELGLARSSLSRRAAVRAFRSMCCAGTPI